MGRGRDREGGIWCLLRVVVGLRMILLELHARHDRGGGGAFDGETRDDIGEG